MNHHQVRLHFENCDDCDDDCDVDCDGDCDDDCDDFCDDYCDGDCDDDGNGKIERYIGEFSSLPVNVGVNTN